jgi:SAM-dependent methyltransferase
MSDAKTYWDRIYAEREPSEVSWYQRDPRLSLELIRRCPLEPEAAVIDVGGGASALADRLLDAGLVRPAVLDISRRALERARERLGPRADEIDWYEADVTHWSPPYRFDLWHDRAVFHFLTEPGDRRRYVRTLRTSLRSRGHLVMAAFGPGGPARCSGLPVVHYDAETLLAELGPGFHLEEEAREEHVTPSGKTQAFRFFRLRRLAPEAR